MVDWRSSPNSSTSRLRSVSSSNNPNPLDYSPAIVNSENSGSVTEANAFSLNSSEDPQMLAMPSAALLVRRRSYTQEAFDKEFDYRGDILSQRTESNLARLKNTLRHHCACSANRLKLFLYTILPILRWLPKYNIKRDLLSDFGCGFTCGIMQIPQGKKQFTQVLIFSLTMLPKNRYGCNLGLAYATVTGLPTVCGLYTSFFPSFVYILFGTSGHVSLGVGSVISLMVGSVRYKYCPSSTIGFVNSSIASHQVKRNITETRFSANGTLLTYYRTSASSESSEEREIDSNEDSHEIISRAHRLVTVCDPVSIVTTLTILVGVIMILMAILRLGFICTYLSDQLITGYTTAASVIVLTTQLNNILGIPSPRHEGIFKLYYIYKELFYFIPRANTVTIAMSFFSIVAILVVKIYINDRFKKKLKMPVPIDLIVMIIMTIISYYYRFHDEYSLKIVGPVPTGLPLPKLPQFDIRKSAMIPDAIIIAVVLYANSVSVAKLYAKRNNYSVDANQELYAYGMVSVVNSLFMGWPAGASISRSSLVESTGGKTQVASIFACCMLLVVILWGGPLIQHLPMCVLSASIIAALQSMFRQFAELNGLWKQSRTDFAIWMVAFLATIILDISIGLAVGLLFAIWTVALRTQKSEATEMGIAGSTEIIKPLKHYSKLSPVPYTKIVRIEAPIYFANAEAIRTQLTQALGFDCDRIARKWLKAKAKQLQEAEAAEASVGFLTKLRSKANILVHKLVVRIRHCGRSDKISAANLAMPEETELDRRNNAVCMKTLSNIPSTGSLPGLVLNNVAPTAEMILPDSIVLDCSAVTYVDLTGVQFFKQIYTDHEQINVKLFFAACTESVLNSLRKCGVYGKKIPTEHFVISVHDARPKATAFVV